MRRVCEHCGADMAWLDAHTTMCKRLRWVALWRHLAGDHSPVSHETLTDEERAKELPR